MKNTLPPSFRVELERIDSDASISRHTTRIINESLLETNSNPISVGEGGSFIIKKKFQPHNYRLYFDFDKYRFNPTREGFIPRNHGKEYHARQLFNGCKIIIKKEKVEVTNLNCSGRWILIQEYSLDAIDERFAEAIAYLDSQCIDALKELIRQYGGFSRYEYYRSKMIESGLQLDDFIDSIPSQYIWKDFPFSKKVYKDKVESMSLPHTRNLIKNLSLQDYSPAICEELTEIRKENNLLQWILSQIHCVQDVFELESDILRLPEEKRGRIGLFLVEKFGGLQ